MRYFRTYPWGLQLLLFMLMVFTFLSATQALVLALLPGLTGYQLTDLYGINPASPAPLIGAAMITQGVQNAFMFGVPALLFGYMAHPTPSYYLGLRRPGKALHWILAVALMAGAMPLLMELEQLMHLFDFGPEVAKTQKANDDLINAFIKASSLPEFIRAFIVMAIVPGIGEELFFRGVLMRFVRKKTSGMVVPILFSAVVFAFAHLNVYGLPSIFLAGVLLAIIYQLTGSLWCSVVAHLFFNGSQVLIQYMANSSAGAKELTEARQVPLYWILAGAALFGGAAYALYKNRTPLPATWANDFAE